MFYFFVAILKCLFLKHVLPNELWIFKIYIYPSRSSYMPAMYFDHIRVLPLLHSALVRTPNPSQLLVLFLLPIKYSLHCSYVNGCGPSTGLWETY